MSNSYCFMIAFILIFKGRRIEILWSVSVEILMYSANKCRGNYWYNNRHSAMILPRKCALPCSSKCGPWTRSLSSRNVHPWTPPQTYQVAVCSLTRSQVIHIHIKYKKGHFKTVPGTLIMNLATLYFVLFRSWQVHVTSHYCEVSALAYHILRNCFH